MTEKGWVSAVLWVAASFSLIIAVVANLRPETFEQAWVCYVVFSSIGLIAFATTGLLVASDIGVLTAFGFLTLQAIMMVATTSAIFSEYGFVHPEEAVLTPSDSLYFSIVTWTTLGYGDFQPKPALRLLAAMQAVYGYLFLGLIVGSVSSLIGKRLGGKREGDDENAAGRTRNEAAERHQPSDRFLRRPRMKNPINH